MRLALQQGLPDDPRLVVAESGRCRRRSSPPSSPLASVVSEGWFSFALSGGYRLAPELYTECLRRLEERLRLYWQNRLTLIALGSLQVRNVVSNLALLLAAR